MHWLYDENEKMYILKYYYNMPTVVTFDEEYVKTQTKSNVCDSNLVDFYNSGMNICGTGSKIIVQPSEPIPTVAAAGDSATSSTAAHPYVKNKKR
jgi:hypothetical protein